MQVNQQNLIAPSILAADLARLGEECTAVLAAGADMIHFDVMDNHYVPNLTFGPMICEAIRNYGITAPLDVHLMVEPVDSLVSMFAKAGASYISFHPEASKHPHRTVALIRDSGCKPGLVLNPGTPLSVIEYLLDDIDLLLLMSVNPGFGGQKFLTSTYDKVRAARSLIDSTGRPIRLEVDGGVDAGNIAQIAKAGADTFVAGSAIFGADSYEDAIQAFRKELAGLRAI